MPSISDLDANAFYNISAKAMFGTPRRKRATMSRCSKLGETPKGLMHEIWTRVARRELRGFKPSTFIFNHVKWIIADGKTRDVMSHLTRHEIEDVYSYDETQTDKVHRSFLRQAISEVCGELTKREQIILEMRFGLEDGFEHTLEQVGKRIGVSRERVRSIESKAIRKLQHPTQAKKLAGYIKQ